MQPIGLVAVISRQAYVTISQKKIIEKDATVDSYYIKSRLVCLFVSSAVCTDQATRSTRRSTPHTLGNKQKMSALSRCPTRQSNVKEPPVIQWDGARDGCLEARWWLLETSQVVHSAKLWALCRIISNMDLQSRHYTPFQTHSQTRPLAREHDPSTSGG
jgi:hypothetical protein